MIKEGNIVVDVGNSSIKSARFVDDELQELKSSRSLEEVYSHFKDYQNYSWLFASVGKEYGEIARIFDHLNPHYLTTSSKLPITLDYKTPETLGVDRIAAAVGGFEAHPDKTVLIIDAGSCITYDLLESGGRFLGGSITPGLEMRMKAMHAFTSQLPDISSEWKMIRFSEVGKTTRECLLSGSISGILYEMKGYIDHFTKEYPGSSVLLTGGDAAFFESKLKPHIFADPNLVLKGLNRILNDNK